MGAPEHMCTSAPDVEYLLEFSKNLEYLNNSNYNSLESLRQEVGNLLWRFYQSL
jgi:hypothetical protein